MDTTTHEERLAAAHAALTDAVAQVTTTEDWQNLLRISGSFHRYSPNNQLLLAAQGAEGVVASFHTWKQIPATNGQPCRIRKGETALRVYAPIRAKRRELDPDTGEIHEPSIVGYKLVPVFHEAQLVAPPDLPVQPKLLDGQEPPPELWNAIAEQIYNAGYSLQRGPLDGPAGAKGVTNFTDHAVTVRNDLAPAQALKTQIHELAHVLMHQPDARDASMTLDRIEVEAESVSYVVCDLLGVNAGSYSIPYVANWASGDTELVQATATKVLTTALHIVKGLEAELGVDLRPNPIAAILNDSPQQAQQAVQPGITGVGTTDDIIYRHLAAGQLDWPALVNSIPAIETHRAADFVRDPAAQAVVLADAGASAEATADVLRRHGLGDDTMMAILTVTVPDSLGATSTLFDRDEAARAVRQPKVGRPMTDSVVADFLVAAGRHPSAVRYLAGTSSQPAEVIDLVEARIRRSGACSPGPSRRAERGLELIDQWSAAHVDAPSQTAGVPSPDPTPPAA